MQIVSLFGYKAVVDLLIFRAQAQVFLSGRYQKGRLLDQWLCTLYILTKKLPSEKVVLIYVIINSTSFSTPLPTLDIINP